MVLETVHVTETGSVSVTEFVHAHRDPGPHIVRIVEGIDGEVPMEMRLDARFGYGTSWRRERAVFVYLASRLTLLIWVPLHAHDVCEVKRAAIGFVLTPVGNNQGTSRS